MMEMVCFNVNTFWIYVKVDTTDYSKVIRSVFGFENSDYYNVDYVLKPVKVNGEEIISVRSKVKNENQKNESIEITFNNKMILLSFF